MTDIRYCKSWFSAKKRPTVLWDEAQARQAHVDRNPYTAVIGGLKRPTHVVYVSDHFVGVDFLDEKLREALSYHFKEVEPGRLFLSMATYRQFDGDSERVIEGTSYVFQRSGEVTVRKESFDPHQLQESAQRLDPAANYEVYPDFGAYDGVCAAERDQAGGEQAG